MNFYETNTLNYHIVWITKYRKPVFVIFIKSVFAKGIGDTLKNLSYFEVIETAMYVLVFMERTSLFECLVCSCSAFHSL